jgi:hypothetical protein
VGCGELLQNFRTMIAKGRELLVLGFAELSGGASLEQAGIKILIRIAIYKYRITI